MTTKRERLLALAERAERAEGPSRELDEAIDRLRRPWPKAGDFDAEECAIWQQTAAGSMLLVRADGFARGSVCAPAYTASIDAATTLVRPGWRFILDKRAYAEVRSDGYRAIVWHAPAIPYDKMGVWAATPALALVAASLRALAAQEEV